MVDVGFPVESRADLIDLLKKLQQLLQQIIETHGDEYLPGDLLADYRAAWPEVDQRFALVLDVVGDPERIDEGDLEEHGLVGPNMRLKHKGFIRHANAFFRRPRRWLAHRALGWADVPLESLAVVFPPTGLIKEFKQAVEQGIEEVEWHRS